MKKSELFPSLCLLALIFAWAHARDKPLLPTPSTMKPCKTSNIYADNNHPGNMPITAGTGGTGTGTVYGLIAEDPSITSANGSLGWTWETAVYVTVPPTTSAGSYQAGMAHNPNENPWTTGTGFHLSSANDVGNHWYCRYSNTSGL